VLKKKIWANFQRIIELFVQKIVTKLSKVWVWDPGSETGIRDPEKTYSGSRIPDQGVKKAPDPGSGSATLVLGIQIRIRMFLGLLGPDQLVRGVDPHPALDPSLFS
jgi:hypothetical protein